MIKSNKKIEKKKQQNNNKIQKKYSEDKDKLKFLFSTHFVYFK